MQRRGTGKAMCPLWLPQNTHASISTETRHISRWSITNLLPRKQEMQNLNDIPFWSIQETPERDFLSAWEGSGNWASNYRFSTSAVLFPGYSVCSRHCLPAILCLLRQKHQTSAGRGGGTLLEWEKRDKSRKKVVLGRIIELFALRKKVNMYVAVYGVST